VITSLKKQKIAKNRGVKLIQVQCRKWGAGSNPKSYSCSNGVFSIIDGMKYQFFDQSDDAFLTTKTKQPQYKLTTSNQNTNQIQK